MGIPMGWELLVIAGLIIILFGGGKKVAEVFKGVGTGIKEFKKALKEEDEESTKPAPKAAASVSEEETHGQSQSA